MSVILTIYSFHALKSYLLPAVNNADYSVFISKNLFNLEHDIQLKLENSNGLWYFRPSEEYNLQYLHDDSDCYAESIQSNYALLKNEMKLLIGGNHEISIIVKVTDCFFCEYSYYDISSVITPITIGRNKENIISFDYGRLNLVSGNHARIIKRGTEYYFCDNNSANGSYLNNVRATAESIRLSFGDCIDIFGLRIIFLRDKIAVNVKESGAAVDDNVLIKVFPEVPELKKINRLNLSTIFHRAPRKIAKITHENIKIDNPPEPKDEIKQKTLLSVIGSAVSMSLPMLLGCIFMIYASRISGVSRGIFMYVGLVTAVTSAIIGSVRSVSGMRQAKKEYEEYERLRNEKYGVYLQNREAYIRQIYEKNTAALRDRYKSSGYCCTLNSGTPDLWSRNINQSDFLTVRLGLGNIPFQSDIEIPDKKFSMTDNHLLDIPFNIKNTYSMLKDVPVCVDLMKERLIGVVGGKQMIGGINVVQNIIVQIAANNVYTDVKLVFIYDEKKSGLNQSWRFARLLPHVWNEAKNLRYIASNKEEANTIFYDLNMVLRERCEENSVRADKKQAVRPYYVMIVVNPELLEGELISRYVLNPEPFYGLTTIYMAEYYEELPNECEFIIENDETFCGMYHLSDGYGEQTVITFDSVEYKEIQQFAENIANVEVREVGTGGNVPATLSFLDMYGVRKPEELNALSRWKKNRTYESMRALIGQKAGGAPCFLDLHEKYHGPHGLVAGTTGSGKSETLQTFILSLAVNFSPDDVGFFIIDYKGGGMANLFSGLPHLIGQISNLSGSQVNRALVSIQSEKDRRETIFKEYGVKDIRDYTKLYKSNETAVPMPHLIIVIDEFAEMKHDEPEFIQEVVSISRVGRSLGIHLIMATQKPSGSVSEDIWSNSRFKLCLRVQSKQDSMDMLHKPDAAYLTQAGRTYLQVGNDELYELFQSGYSGASYLDDEGNEAGFARMLDMDGIPSIEGTHAQISRQREKKTNWIQTLLDIIKEVYGGEYGGLNHKSREEKNIIASLIFKHLKGLKYNYPETGHNREDLIYLLAQVGKYGFHADKILEEESELVNTSNKLPQMPVQTQLEAVSAYLKETAEQNNYKHDFSLFLPLLPGNIYLEDLHEESAYGGNRSFFDGKKWTGQKENGKIEADVGIYDDPENRKQDTVTLNFAKSGNILLLGSPLSGKSTFLSTLAFDLVNKYLPNEVNIYAMQFSAGKFTAFEKVPHFGDIVKDTDDNERIDKLFMMLNRILKERKEVLRDSNYDQYTAFNGLKAMPAIFILIDNFAALSAKTGDKHVPFIQKLIKEGTSNGIYLIVSALGINSNEISHSLAQNFKTVICLELNNEYDYGNYMRRSRLRIKPEAGIKGRGLVCIEERILEFQTALPVKAENEIEVNKIIRRLSDQMDTVWNMPGARRIPEIPEKPDWEEFAEVKEVQLMAATDHMLPVGYDAESADIYAVDLSEIYTYLITGARKKGKTNCLKTIMNSARRKNGRLIVIDYSDQFPKICSDLGAERITGELEWYEWLKAFLPEVGVRNSAKYNLAQQGMEDKEIYHNMKKYKPVFIFVDNLPDFINRVYHPTEAIPQTYFEIMEKILTVGYIHNIYWFCTICKEDLGSVAATKLFKAFTQDKKGIHLGGLVHATAVGMNFENQDRRTVDIVKPAGRGLLPADNGTEVKEIVIPLVKGMG